MIVAREKTFLDWKEEILKPYRSVSPFATKIGLLERCDYICIRISDKILVIGNGGIKRTDTFQEDPALLSIVNQLRQIEHQIFVESKKAHVNYYDFDKMKPIIETITI